MKTTEGDGGGGGEGGVSPDLTGVGGGGEGRSAAVTQKHTDGPTGHVLDMQVTTCHSRSTQGRTSHLCVWCSFPDPPAETPSSWRPQHSSVVFNGGSMRAAWKLRAGTEWPNDTGRKGLSSSVTEATR